MSHTEEAAPIETEIKNDKFKWYAVITQSGMEKKAKAVLEERIKKFKLVESFGQVIIPSQHVERVDEKGKKKLVEQRLMPGYLFVQMDMTEQSYHCVKDTPKIASFAGAKQSKQPMALPDEEVDRVLNRAAHLAKERASKVQTSFERGEKVRVIDGPFTNFVGDVDEVRADKAKLKLLISVFGRPTPVELEFSKVEKIKD